jgi:hypothetical protein
VTPSEEHGCSCWFDPEEVQEDHAMRQRIWLRPGARLTKPALSLLAAMAVTGASEPAVRAEGGDAQGFMRTMADYIGCQENLSLKYDADVEVMTPACGA